MLYEIIPSFHVQDIYDKLFWFADVFQIISYALDCNTSDQYPYNFQNIENCEKKSNLSWNCVVHLPDIFRLHLLQ